MAAKLHLAKLCGDMSENIWQHLELGIPGSVACDCPTLQKALQTPGFVNHQNTLQVQVCALYFNGEILAEDWQDFSVQRGCTQLCSCQILQILCTPAILSKPIKLLLISYLRWRTTGSESVSVVYFHWTAFSVQVEQVQIAAGVKSFYRGSWQISAFLFP